MLRGQRQELRAHRLRGNRNAGEFSFSAETLNQVIYKPELCSVQKWNTEDIETKCNI
jgi:hypothetical protein